MATPPKLIRCFLAALASASVRGRIATGNRAGQAVLRFGDRIDAEDLEPRAEDDAPPRCATIAGVSVHANVAVPARDRGRLERLCRYVARPPLCGERLSRLGDGRLLYRLKRRWSDGTLAMVFEPHELIEKLAALVPPPRLNLVRYHGVLAPAFPQRKLLDHGPVQDNRDILRGTTREDKRKDVKAHQNVTLFQERDPENRPGPVTPDVRIDTRGLIPVPSVPHPPAGGTLADIHKEW